MTSPAQPAPFSFANQHALATILDAAQTKSIIASSDIFDISGIKLWARDQPVSQALQRKLLDRQLRNPLETCLMAEDGVTQAVLTQALEAELARSTPLSPLLRPRAARLLQEVPSLPLHSVAQLLLTAGQASRPASFEHAIQAMALCGALMINHGGSTVELRVAMLCGLLHDLGEMYIDPRHGETDAESGLDFETYQQLVVHPHVGHLLLLQLTDYPKSLARAVAEHHERLDGSGYPHALLRDAVSPLGRMMAVTEAALAVLRDEGADLARVSVALRVVPSEFDLSWVGRIADAARPRHGDTQPLASSVDLAQVQARLLQLDAALQSTQGSLDALMGSVQTDALKGAFLLAHHLLGRLRTGWYASGLWSSEAVDPQDAAEVQAVQHELHFRLRAIERAALLRAGELPPADARLLAVFCENLRAVTR